MCFLLSAAFLLCLCLYCDTVVTEIAGMSRACEVLGVARQDLFEPDDLLEQKDLEKGVLCCEFWQKMLACMVLQSMLT